MKLSIDFPKRLLGSLQGLDLAELEVRVKPSNAYKYFGIVVSPSFEGMGEAKRQALVWDRILKTLDDDDQERIEFLFTDTPAERSALLAPSAPTA